MRCSTNKKDAPLEWRAPSMSPSEIGPSSRLAGRPDGGLLVVLDDVFAEMLPIGLQRLGRRGLVYLPRLAEHGVGDEPPEGAITLHLRFGEELVRRGFMRKREVGQRIGTDIRRFGPVVVEAG